MPTISKAVEKEGQAMVDSELFEKGLEMRRQVLGAKYVDANHAGSDEFMMTFQAPVLNWRGATLVIGPDLIGRHGAS